jgi:hypothetical protein
VKTPRSPEVCLEALRELVDDPRLGPVAETALTCVALHGADPGMLLAVIEAAQDGGVVSPGKAERDRQRREQGRDPSEPARILTDRGGAL